eukprot:15262418-Alexandrium_andersonii.AAC.1
MMRDCSQRRSAPAADAPRSGPPQAPAERPREGFKGFFAGSAASQLFFGLVTGVAEMMRPLSR